MRYRLAHDPSWLLPFGPGIPRARIDALPVAGEGVCSRVSDADGLEVHLDGKVERVRLAGVDGPELGARDDVERARARQCKARLTELAHGKLVRCYFDPLQRSSDAYGRLVCYVVRCEDGLDLCRVLIEERLAGAWRGGKYCRRREFVAVERETGGGRLPRRKA